jgi:hypothetical protein
MAKYSTETTRKVRVLRIIARMNVGGPAVQVSGLMRGFNQEIFEQELLTGFCAADEADYLEKVAPDVKASRIDGLGRSIKSCRLNSTFRNSERDPSFQARCNSYSYR